jgi:uncharacterized protein (TIGR03067 family)
MALLTTLVVATASAVTAAGDEKAKQALSKLGGTWVAQSREYEGKVESKSDLKGLTLVISGDKFAFTSDGGKPGLKGRLAVDPTTNPKGVDVIVTDKEGKESVIRGIYELDGDTLRSAVPQTGGGRPKGFTAKAGSNVRVTVYKRSGD